jgi:isoquinoline 1-oxidoreductase beta subunit
MYRALGYNHTTFSKEVMMDELARAAGQDELAFRLAHLGSKPRQAAALKLAAEHAGWGRPLPPGRALGISIQEAYDTVVVNVAQVHIEDGRVVVERVVCAIDCGMVINPGNMRAQMEGGIAFGLSAVLHNELTLDGGRVQQSNFHDAAMLRMSEMPDIEVLSLASDAPPTGIGEPGSVPIIAAVANAVARLTGKPVRSLPIKLDALTA